MTAVNTIRVKGKTKRFRAGPGSAPTSRRRSSPSPRAQKIDFTTGMIVDGRWHSRTFKPITPGLRGTRPDRPQRALEGQAGQGADRRQAQHGGRNNHGRITAALPRRRPQAALPHRRFQAAQVRRAGDGRAARIRSEPHRLHRAGAATRTASSPTSWRRSGSRRATRWSPASASTSSRAMRCRCATSRSARSSTMSR